MKRQEIRRLFLKELRKIEGSVLEIGFGEPLFFKKYAKFTSVHGIDRNTSIVRNTQITIDKMGLQSQVWVSLGSAMELPYDDDKFDAIVLSFVFCCIEDCELLVKELSRVCNKGGYVYSFDHYNSANYLFKLVNVITPLYLTINSSGCRLNFNPYQEINMENTSLLIREKSEESILPWVFSKWRFCS